MSTTAIPATSLDGSHATPPDEDVAAELERAAARAQAQARGGLAVAAAFLQRAAELTPEPGRSAHRALAAAHASYHAGALDEALALLATAAARAAGDLEPASVQLLRAQIALASTRGGDAPLLLLEAARELEAVDPPLARATYLDALLAEVFAGRPARAASATEEAHAVRGGPPSLQPPRRADLLLRGLALHVNDGPSVGTPVLKRAVRAFLDGEVAAEQGMCWLWLAGRAAGLIWDYEGWDALTARQIRVARNIGALTMLPVAVTTRTGVHLFAGELAAAAALVEESAALSRATVGRVPYAPLTLAAFRGREDEFKPLIQTSTNDFMASGKGVGLAMAQWAAAVLYNGLARYEDALGAAERAAENPREPWFSNWVAVELIEAASRTGQVERAAYAMEWLSTSARAGRSDWGLGVEARSRALLSEGDAAERLYREAIERLQRTRLRVDLARAQLVYGEWLRRERRRLDSREHLRTALEMFRDMDMDGFAGRAERELSATGERARKRTVETREELTAQEAQVARLARDGLANSAIGERLFISQHTVAYHLRKVFTKLDVTSRNQLGHVLPPSSDPARLA